MTETLALACLHTGKQDSWRRDEISVAITQVDAEHQLLQTVPQGVAEILLAQIKDIA